MTNQKPESQTDDCDRNIGSQSGHGYMDEGKSGLIHKEQDHTQNEGREHRLGQLLSHDIGKEKCIPRIISGLESLEYRGYDSAGIAYVTEGNVEIRKEEGRIEKVQGVSYESFSQRYEKFPKKQIEWGSWGY